MKKYLIIVEEIETGYSAYSPDVPGCGSTVKTSEEVERNIREAIEFHLEGRREEGCEIPERSSYSSSVEVFAVRYVLTLAVGCAMALGLLFGGGPTGHARVMPQDRPCAGGRGDAPARQLHVGVPIEEQLAGGEAHTYTVLVEAGQYLHSIVEQRGIDVIVTLFGPGAQKLIEVDSPNGTQGPEIVSTIGKTSGAYCIEVRSLEQTAAPGRYQVRVETLRRATPDDLKRAAAEEAYVEGERLRAAGTAESLRRAAEQFERARALKNALGDQRGEAAAVDQIGTIYNLLGEPQRALDYYLRSLAIWHALADPSGQAVSSTNIGAVYYVLGEPQKALDYFRQSLVFNRAVGDRSGESGTLTNIGTIYRFLGEPQRALDYFNQALPLKRQVGDRLGEATTLNNIGTVYQLLDEPQKAIDFFKRALTILQASGQRRVEAVTLANLGTVYNSTGEPGKALELLDRALVIVRTIGDRNFEAGTLANIGLVYRSMGEVPKAVKYLDDALSLRRVVGDRRGEAVVLFELARLEGGRGNLDAARAHIEAALSIVDSLRSKVMSRDLRASYHASVQDFYKLFIDILMQMHARQPAANYDAAAFHANERARARSLLDTLVESSADIRRGVDPVLIERERSFQRMLNARAEQQLRLLSGKHTEEQARDIKSQIEGLLAQLDAVGDELKEHSPRYAALTQPQPLTLAEIQSQLLQDDTLLLAYSLGDERSYLWAVTKQTRASYQLPPRASVELAARRCYGLLTARNRRVKFETADERRARIRQADADYPTAAADLTGMLLGPVAGQLGSRRLLVVLDGALEYIPFGALPVPVGQGAAKFVPLIHGREVTSVPSASTLAVLRRELQGRREAAKTVAVFADPVFEASDERVGGGGRGRSNAGDEGIPQRRDSGEDGPAALDAAHAEQRSAPQEDVEQQVRALPRLPYTRREAQAILALSAPRERMVALDFEANRAAVTDSSLSQYRIIHFATHSFLNSYHPELSGIVLSMVDRNGRPQDGFLRAHEVFNLRLGAELVVLSGCRTGLGKEVRGEGLIGLTRGFMYAGARRVIVSLWDVQDEATAALMTRLYHEMLGPKRSTPAAALREAQLETLREGRWDAPYYWAGFVLQGEPR